MGKGKCLVSQEILEFIKKGKIITGPNFSEFKIQPSSLDSTIGGYLYELDTKEGSVRPKTNEKVRRKLLSSLTGRQRGKRDISGGYELKKGFSYLIPLEEKLKLSEGEHVKFSTKSRIGRIFTPIRLFGDCNHCFDELNSQYAIDTELNLWLLVQPIVFNIIVRPGISLNQARFFKGVDAKLSDSEIISVFKENPFLFDRKDNGDLVAVEPYVNEGIQLHLDLTGRFSNGVVGLRARHNPTPIDVSEEEKYVAEEYFEPLFAKDGRLAVEKGDFILLGSKEYLKLPDHLNAELESNHHASLKGEWHKAAFVNNGFGKKHGSILLYELFPEENIVLEDGMPASRLKIFKTAVPDKKYGEEIGSNYSFQPKVQVPKFFKPFNFEDAAQTNEKLTKKVLVQDSKILTGYRTVKEGFECLNRTNAEKLLEDIANGFFHTRYDCETDEEVLQIIPYVLVFDDKVNVFSYVRAQNIKDYSEKRLSGKHSIGLGGHIEEKDGPSFVSNCVFREVIDEEIEIEEAYAKPVLVGTLMSYISPVNRVHFGLIHTMHVEGAVSIKGKSAESGGFVNIEELMNNVEIHKNYEDWSRILISQLPALYNITTSF